MRPVSFSRSFLIVLAALPVQAAFGLQIAGSDLLDDGIRNAIVDELQATGIEADVTLEGSLLGMEALQDGGVDACILAVPEGSGPVSSGKAYSFGFQIVAFAVNDNNPLNELDYRQLENLFRSNGTIENWSDLIPSDEWQDRKVNLYAARSGTAIPLEIFNSVVLRGSPLKAGMRYPALDSEQLMRTVANDASALMIIPNIKPVPGVRLLAVKADATAQSYKPSEDNVFYGDYPLRLPFQLVVSNEVDVTTLSVLLRTIYSDRVTQALVKAYYIPVPETERQAVLNQLK